MLPRKQDLHGGTYTVTAGEGRRRFRISEAQYSKMSMPTLLNGKPCKKGILQHAVLAVYAEHKDDGMLPTSLRFITYELGQLGLIDKHVDSISGPAMDLRNAGLIPWNAFADETRELKFWKFRATVADYVMDSIDSATIDYWPGEDAPLVLCESRSLKGVLERMVSRYNVPIAATNGQAGGFLHTDLVPILEDTDRQVLYLGDFDKQGEHIEEHTESVLREHAKGWTGFFHRLAITPEQIEQFDIQPILKGDARYRPESPDRFNNVYETEALSQAVIVDIVRNEIESWMPQPLEEVHKEERKQARKVRRILEAIDFSAEDDQDDDEED